MLFLIIGQIKELFILFKYSTTNDQTEFAKWLYQIPTSCEEAKTGRLQLHRSCAYTQKSLGELQKEL